MDRAMNPHDGSRRRLKSAAHKSTKDYDRRINKQIKEEDTMESIEEGNILIAEFLGYKVQTEDEFNSLADDDSETNIVVLEWLDYHKNWNRLMPIVEKINSMKDEYGNLFEFKIGNGYVWVDPSVSDRIFFSGNDIGHRDEPMIDKVYRGVVAFVKWYNAAANIKDKE
jgi:hypothetical protein